MAATVTAGRVVGRKPDRHGSKRKVANDFQTSLEEAAVRRPGRKAGIRNDRTLERRRCGTGIMKVGSNAAIFSQLLSYGWPEFDMSAAARWVRAAGADVARSGGARPLPPARLPLMNDVMLSSDGISVYQLS